MKNLLSIVCFALGLAFTAGQAQGQTGAGVPAPKLTEHQWKAVEGYFQSQQNSEQVVQFIANDSFLLAKLMWNGSEIHLVPRSDLVFVSKEMEEGEPIQIEFRKDSATGLLNRVDVRNNGTLVRIKEYRPVERKVMAHTPEQLKAFEGLYQFSGGQSQYLQLRENDNKLILKQLWDGREISFVPESELNFYSPQVHAFTLAFSKDPAGNISQVMAFGRDLWIKQKKASLTASRLKSYEGNFQSTDDPDNEIRLIATDNGLKIIQLWDKKEISVEPLTDTFFNNGDLSYPVQIVSGPDGKVTQVILLSQQVFKKITH